MGCDIHAYQEQKVDGKWTYCGEVDLYRNYTLFTVLANVRSSSNRVKIISKPKGLPSDISNEVKEEYDHWDCDGHSHSFLTKEEFEEFDWSSGVRIGGTVDCRNYQEYLDKGMPSSWCGGVGGPNIEIVDEDKMKTVMNIQDDGKKYYCYIEWEDALMEYLDDAYKTIKEIFDQPIECRIIFWFDN